MRRTAPPFAPVAALVAVAVALAGAVAAVGLPAHAADPRPADSRSVDARSADAGSTGPGSVRPQRVVAQRAMAVAQRVLEGRPAPRDPSATLALRDLWRSLGDLSGDDRARAEAMLARPTDGAGDPFGLGYTTRSTKKCAKDVCVHWVRSTADAPPSKAWVRKNLKEMQRVYRATTKRYGYRKPLPDGRRGGNKLFDVYLKDIGGFGLYGYCATEKRVQRFLATGYCVLDNDYARAQFGRAPKKSLKVTAAHEFFHAVQYAYDAEDDRWLMESTATWMEERLADGANDNRQYLPFGQVNDPSQPLDSAGGGQLNQYGNWAFFEFLSTVHGHDIVRQIWSRMAADRTSPDDYSLQAVGKVLRKRGGFARNYAEFAAANTDPGRTYPEGDRWPSAPIGATATLSKSTRSLTPYVVTLDHLTSWNLELRPDSSLKSGAWKLKLQLSGPRRRAAPAAYVLVDKRKGEDEKRYVKVNRLGRATVKLGFSSRKVKKVTVTLANASTRFDCYRQTTWSCQGQPRDDGRVLTLAAAVRK